MNEIAIETSSNLRKTLNGKLLDAEVTVQNEAEIKWKKEGASRIVCCGASVWEDHGRREFGMRSPVLLDTVLNERQSVHSVE